MTLIESAPKGTGQRGSTLFADDFRNGLRHDGPGAAWLLRPVESFPHGDGDLSVTDEGLVVVPTGTNADTGHPAFVRPTGHQGDTEFLRWATFTKTMSANGVLGFDLPPGGEITGSVRLGAEIIGTDRHPLGADVVNHNTDMRLGAGALIGIDLETGLVLDLVLTNHKIFALYERLPRPASDHAMFSYSVPVADRTPGQKHRLEISVGATSSGRAVWRVDGQEVLAVDQLGLRCLDRTHLLREDSEGTEELVAPRQINFGLALFAAGLWGQGARLVADDLRVEFTSHL